MVELIGPEGHIVFSDAEEDGKLQMGYLTTASYAVLIGDPIAPDWSGILGIEIE